MRGGIGRQGLSTAAADGAASLGVFQNVYIKPFPVRAAIDIGTGGMISLSVARVDARQGALRDVMYQTQLPLHLQSATPLSSSDQLHAVGPSSPFTLSDATRHDIRNKMRILHGALRRDAYEGLSECAALISWPLCDATDALPLATQLTREFKVDVRVLGKTFQPELPSRPHTECDPLARGTASASGEFQFSLRRTLQGRAARRGAERNRPNSALSPIEAADGRRRMAQLSFLAHAAGSRCLAPERMIVLTESAPNACVSLLAMERETSAVGPGGSSWLVRPYTPPLDAADALQLLLTRVQRRPEGGRRSPNPVRREEWTQLRDLIAETLAAALPDWVRQRAALGGVVCASSGNGGVLNTAARVAQRTSIAMEHLDTHAALHFCGLTDVLLAENFPDPLAVLPNTALASALMRTLGTRRVAYLPSVSVADALLLQPSLWVHGRQERIRAELESKTFFKGGSRARTFQRPHKREDPTAAPNAVWQLNQSWNPTSQINSSKGL